MRFNFDDLEYKIPVFDNSLCLIFMYNTNKSQVGVEREQAINQRSNKVVLLLTDQ